MKCNTLRDEIERLIWAGHFKEFLENEPQIVVMNERLRQSSLERIREVLTIFRGPHVVGKSRNVGDRYAKEVWSALLAHVHRTDECPVQSAQWELEDVVFIKVDVKWVHHLCSDAFVITARVANSNVHRMLVDSGSAVNIIYLDAYKRLRLTNSELSPTTCLSMDLPGIMWSLKERWSSQWL